VVLWVFHVRERVFCVHNWLVILPPQEPTWLYFRKNGHWSAQQFFSTAIYLLLWALFLFSCELGYILVRL
jgi:hypothetical protein